MIGETEEEPGKPSQRVTLHLKACWLTSLLYTHPSAQAGYRKAQLAFGSKHGLSVIAYSAGGVNLAWWKGVLSYE